MESLVSYGSEDEQEDVEVPSKRVKIDFRTKVNQFRRAPQIFAQAAYLTDQNLLIFLGFFHHPLFERKCTYICICASASCS